MKKIVFIVGALIFLVVAGVITVTITQTIFNKVAGDITEQIAGSLIPGASSPKIEKKPCNVPKHQREFNKQPYYEGPLIDSHVHLPTSSSIVSSVAKQNGLELPLMEGDIAADRLICIFDSEGIIKTFGFHITSQYAEGAAVATATAIEEAYPGKIVHFLMPPPVLSLNLTPSSIEGILRSNKGLFKGFGEVALYMDGYQGVMPNASQLKEIYKLADEHNLIVMVHPEDNLRDGIEEILREFPEVTFFFHGGKHQEWLIELMPTHKNFYYSVDADLVSLYGAKNGYKYQEFSSKEEYVTFLKGNFESVLKEALGHWKPIIEKYPDRFTWGTDRWYAWHFDPEVGGLLEEFGRSFIGKLDPSVQEKFAYKNAEAMLGN